MCQRKDLLNKSQITHFKMAHLATVYSTSKLKNLSRKLQPSYFAINNGKIIFQMVKEFSDNY